MVYSEKLANRIRVILDGKSIEEKKMFGGLCFMHRGHMACGIVADELMVRIGTESYEKFLGEKHTREMTFTGKALKGMLYVGVDGIKTKAQLSKWVKRSLDFTNSLPKKTAKKKAKKTAKKKSKRR